MIKEDFTKKLQEWILVEDEKKDWNEGAVMLLQLTGNRIMYQNICRNPKSKAEFIKGKLEQYLKFRLKEQTHEEVATMEAKVDTIIKDTVKPKGDFEDFKAGKRSDHDLLPEEIQAKYVENLDILRRMRELHLQLRKLSEQSLTCPDAERYPFLKEMIELDKQLHENWDAYDHYSVIENQESAKTTAQATSNAKSTTKKTRKKK